MPGPEISRDAITPKVSPPPQLSPNEVAALEKMLSNDRVQANLSPIEVKAYKTVVDYNKERSWSLMDVPIERRAFLWSLGALGTTLGVTGASLKTILSAGDDERGAYVRADTDTKQALSGDPRNLNGRLPSTTEEYAKAKELEKVRQELANELVDEYKKPREFISKAKSTVGSVGMFFGVIGSVVSGIITGAVYKVLLKSRRKAKTELHELDVKYSRLLSLNPPSTNSVHLGGGLA